MRWKAFLVGLAALLLIAPAAARAVSGSGADGAQVWGYDLPYSYAYGAGVPFYTGHNSGEPSGGIYEQPARDIDGMFDPAVVRGDRAFVQEQHARAQLVVTRIQDLTEGLVARAFAQHCGP